MKFEEMRKDGADGDILIQELINSGKISLSGDDENLTEDLSSNSVDIGNMRLLSKDEFDKIMTAMEKAGVDTNYTVS